MGGVQGEYFDRLVKLVEEGVNRGTGVTFFYNKWKPEEPASLSAAVAEPYTGKKGGGTYPSGGSAQAEGYEEQIEEE